MIKSGLVSISFRKLSYTQILDLMSAAGLQAIEWGGDVHVPHGDVATAVAVGAATRARGLTVAAYGSYYRVGQSNDFSFAEVLASAQALGASVIRVWAGRTGSASADAQMRRAVVQDSRRIAEAAAAAGIRVAYEFHANTLTDTTESAVALLQEVNHPNLRCYWQPPHGLGDAELRQSLRSILPWLENLHVFYWDADKQRQPLAAGQARWQSLLAELRPQAADAALAMYALLEFVRDDDPQQLQQDAVTLKTLLAEPQPTIP